MYLLITNLQKLKRYIVFFLLNMCMFSLSSHGKNYYFSNSNGNDSRTSLQAQNSASPWKSLEKLNSSDINLTDGDSVLFKKGDIWIGTTFEPRFNNVVYSNYGIGQLPIIDGGKNIAINISISYKTNITIDGITFKRTGTIGIVAQLGNAWSDLHSGIINCKIRNCIFLGGVILLGSYNIFEDNIVDGSSNDGNGNGIWEHHKYCHHNIYKNNNISNFTLRGIWTMIDTHDSVFEYNTIHGCKFAGIDLDGAYYVVYGHSIKNNKIYNIDIDSIELENAFDCIVSGNYMYNGGRSYIYIINYKECKIIDGHGAINGLGAKLNTTLYGNVMIGGGVDYSSVAIGIHKAGGINIFNNSIYNFKSRFFDLDYTYPTEVTMIKLLNNIFSTINTPSWYAMINFSTNDLDILEEDDYNCFYNNGKNDIYSDRNTYNLKSLSQYRVLTRKGIHSISVDPLFINKNDLHLQETSPCINLGKNIGLPYLDKAPDMGAYEYPSSPKAEMPICAATGTILREQWNNISGTAISSIPIQTAPNSTSQLTSFESPSSIGDNYAARIRGYICAPQTGSYTFWLAGDNACELWLSTDDNPAKKVRIANVAYWTNKREWIKYASQKSIPITLQAGKKYYIEALHKEMDGGDHLSVQWQLPNGMVESPLPGKYLSPYVGDLLRISSFTNDSNGSTDLALLKNNIKPVLQLTGETLFVFPNPTSLQTNIEFTLRESAWVILSIYDSKGLLMRNIFEGLGEENFKKSFVLDAGSLPNGVYIIQLKSGTSTWTKKVAILK